MERGNTVSNQEHVKVYRVQFRPDSNAHYLVVISRSLLTDKVCATIVAINHDSPMAKGTYQGAWNIFAEDQRESIEDLSKEVNDELRSLNGGKSLEIADEHWAEREQ
jgi:hypothetical protein